jgi:hypothetical protein
MKLWLGVLFALTASPMALADAYEGPMKHYQPTLDITKDPGCGKPLKTKEERIAHNRKLAELYFLNYQEYYTRKRQYGWHHWGCRAEGATTLLGGVEPLGTPRTRAQMLEAMGNPSVPPMEMTGAELNPEELAYLDAFETYGTQKGTLVVVPFEEGAFFRMMYGGIAKDDGKNYANWETNLILVNEEGKITHFEMWNDTMGWDKANRKVFGVGLDEVDGLPGYIKLMNERLQQKQKAASK